MLAGDVGNPGKLNIRMNVVHAINMNIARLSSVHLHHLLGKSYLKPQS